MEKIVISSREITETLIDSEQPARPEPKLPPVVPRWAKASMAPLVLVLPVLCILTIVFRVAMRSLPPRTRHGWTAFLGTLLVVSGLLTSMAAVMVFSFVPLPSMVSTGLSELDERSEFPHIPFVDPASAKDISEKLKPLVAVITPGQQSWLTHTELPSASFGAGMLMQATVDGYLFVTARHVVDGAGWRMTKRTSRALIAMSTGTWGAADVIARHKDLDLALLWVSREEGQGTFVQPIAMRANVAEGEPIFVIGHPKGLRFTLSTGIISRTAGSLVQISAPVSPGNSGGPVFDSRGELVGIVTSMVDKQGDPNAENLNFAVRADALLEDSAWSFEKFGSKRLADYQASVTRDKVNQALNHP